MILYLHFQEPIDSEILSPVNAVISKTSKDAPRDLLGRDDNLELRNILDESNVSSMDTTTVIFTISFLHVLINIY